MSTLASFPLVTVGLTKPQFKVSDYTEYRFNGRLPYAEFAKRISALQDFAETQYPSQRPIFLASTFGGVIFLIVLVTIFFLGIGFRSMLGIFFAALLLAFVSFRARKQFVRRLMAFEQNLHHLLQTFTTSDLPAHGIKWQLSNAAASLEVHPNSGLGQKNDNCCDDQAPQFVVEVVDLSVALDGVSLPPPAYVPINVLPTYEELEKAQQKQEDDQKKIATQSYEAIV